VWLEPFATFALSPDSTRVAVAGETDVIVANSYSGPTVDR
jgi:hypothetical protein